jgi:acetyl esterase/lipase
MFSHSPTTKQLHFINTYGRSLELAILQSAIVISPDYRLLPEANGADILADVEAFWTWMRDDLPSIADQESWHVSPDLNRIACVGESAGGWLAVHSSLLFSSRIEIKAVISISAPLGDSGAIKYSVPGPRVIMGARPPPARQAELMIKKYIRAIKPGAIRSVGDPAEMWQLLLCIFR